MEKRRTIMIFPEFDNVSAIENIRRLIDPLAALVRPHITLVYPFSCELNTDDIQSVLADALANEKPFQLRMQSFSCRDGEYGNYLFLNIADGSDTLIRMHKSLYAGKLRAFRNLPRTYSPHMTVGKLPTKDAMEAALREIHAIDTVFSTVIKKVSVEIIGEHEESLIETEYLL
jgi:2'-5' RNA ligase